MSRKPFGRTFHSLQQGRRGTLLLHNELSFRFHFVVIIIIIITVRKNYTDNTIIHHGRYTLVPEQPERALMELCTEHTLHLGNLSGAWSKIQGTEEQDYF